MLKLMKYEWKKQWFSKLVMIGILALLVISFMIFSQMGKSDNMAVVIAFMILAMFLFSTFSGIEAIVTFHRDLKSRQSYLLLMIPQPAWKMLAAKVIIALLSMLFTAFLSGAAAALCFFHEIAKEGLWHTLWESITDILSLLVEDLPRLTDLIPPLFNLFFHWFFIVMLAFLADIVIMTLFSTVKKGAGLLGGVLFLALAYVSSLPLRLLRADDALFFLTRAHAWISCGYYAALSILLFVGISWLAEHKLSV